MPAAAAAHLKLVLSLSVTVYAVNKDLLSGIIHPRPPRSLLWMDFNSAFMREAGATLH